MNTTPIFTSRKLEKTIDTISENQDFQNEYLGEWIANLFYVSHKKCWIIINKKTKYILVLEDVKKSDLKKISKIFKDTLFNQLIKDKIKIEREVIENLIGEVNLYPTNNDRSANGSLNNCLLFFEDWKNEFGSFENMDFRDLNSRLNSSPNKMIDWKYPKEKMAEVLKAYA